MVQASKQSTLMVMSDAKISIKSGSAMPSSQAQFYSPIKTTFDETDGSGKNVRQVDMIFTPKHSQ